MNSRPSRSSASRSQINRATSRAPQAAAAGRGAGGARRRSGATAAKSGNNPALMWGGIGAGVLALAVGVYLLSGPKAKKAEPPTPSGYSQMQAYQGDTPKTNQTPKVEPRKTTEQLAAERRKAEEDRIDALVSKLEREVDPKVIQREADWPKLTTLVADAEKLVGLDPRDRRSAVSGTLEEKKAAKAKADQALEILESNRVFRDMIQTYDLALGEASNFVFFQDVRNRVNTLRGRLKGL